MLDSKRFVMLGALLFLIVGIVGVVSLFDGGSGAGVTGASVVDVGLIEHTGSSERAGCVDLDGENVFLASSVLVTNSDGKEKEYRDVCINDFELLEYVCIEDEVQSVKIPCEHSCSAKACVE